CAVRGWRLPIRKDGGDDLPTIHAKGAPMSDSIFSGGPPLTELSARARRLRNTLEPLASNVYFAPEVHAEFEALGFGPPTGGEGCVTLAEISGYYCSRAGCMGEVRGEVV